MNLARVSDAPGSSWRADLESDRGGQTLPLAEEGLAPRTTGVGFGLLAVLVHDLPIGILVVDASLRVTFVNPRGLAILEQGDGLALVAGMLRSEESALLESRVLRLLRGDPDPDGTLDVPFHLPRPSGRRPFEITLRAPSLVDASHRGATLRHVCMYVRDPDAGVPIDEASLRERYGLTPAEARTAVALAIGGKASEHPELCKLRPMTIRGYVKQIFAKTGTHAQLDVLRLILTGAKSMVIDRTSPVRARD